MKVVIFGGTPGSGKTSIIKFIIQELKDLKIHYAKFDVLNTDDDLLIKQKFGISTENKISGEVCPDHYAALEMPKIIEQHKDKDVVIIETAGLCLRCSPYINEGLAVNVLNILAGKPASYGPLLTDADVIVVSKGDLISQAEREIFRSKILEVNKKALIIDGNGLTGEGAIDVAEEIRKIPNSQDKLTLKNPMPTGICGYCYGNKILNSEETLKRYTFGKELKARVPNLNCGKCGFKSCNEFIRAVLDKKINEDKCPYIKKEEIKNE
jgi:Ni2+-binding GTPase involved in maturation of urease and hydrogenase